MRADSHMFVGGKDLAQRIAAVDEGPDFARLDARPYLLANCVKTARPGGGFQSSQRAARQGQSFHE